MKNVSEKRDAETGEEFFRALGNIPDDLLERAESAGAKVKSGEKARSKNFPAVRRKAFILIAALVGVSLILALTSVFALITKNSGKFVFSPQNIYCGDGSVPYFDSFDEYRENYFAEKNAVRSVCMPKTFSIEIDGETFCGGFTGMSGNSAVYSGDGFEFSIDADSEKMTHFVRTPESIVTSDTGKRGTIELLNRMAKDYIDVSECRESIAPEIHTIGAYFYKNVDGAGRIPYFTIYVDRKTGTVTEITDSSSEYDESFLYDLIVNKKADFDGIEEEVRRCLVGAITENTHSEPEKVTCVEKKAVCIDGIEEKYAISFKFYISHDGNIGNIYNIFYVL